MGVMHIPGHERQKPREVTLDEIRSVLGDCRLCPLHETRTKIVFGVGNPRARVMFVGEAPGRNEDLQGEPFVGRAGENLNAILSLAGFGYFIYRGFTTGLTSDSGSGLSAGMVYVILALCLLVSALLYFIMLGTNTVFAFLLPMVFYLGSGVFAFLNRGDDMQMLIAAVAAAVLAVISLILAITSRGGDDYDDDDYDDAFEDDYADDYDD